MCENVPPGLHHFMFFCHFASQDGLKVQFENLHIILVSGIQNELPLST